MTAFNIVFGFIIGAATGSFLTAALYRLPRGYTLSGRSICPSCGRQLKNQDNIPLLGYLRLRGKSSCCGEVIPIRYFLYELSAAIIGALIGYLGGLLACFITLGVVVLVSLIWSFLTERRPVGGVDD